MKSPTNRNSEKTVLQRCVVDLCDIDGVPRYEVLVFGLQRREMEVTLLDSAHGRSSVKGSIPRSRRPNQNAGATPMHHFRTLLLLNTTRGIAKGLGCEHESHGAVRRCFCFWERDL